MSDTVSVAFRTLIKKGTVPIIMQILPSLNSGGVEQGVIDINKAIVKAGGISIVVSSGGKRVPEITRDGGKHIELPVHSKNIFTMIANIRRLRKIIRNNHVDVVHACSRAPAWSAKAAVRRTNAKYLTSCHIPLKNNFPFKKWYNSSITKGELVITVSNFLSELLENEYHVDPEKLRAIHRGVDLSRYNPSLVSQDRVAMLANQWRVPDDSLVVFLPGRITRIKGHMFVVDALEKLGRKDVFCAFAGKIKGKESYAAELEKYIKDKNLGSQIRLVGTCNDMPSAYTLSSVTLMPTLAPEGFGRIAIEAQAMGRPIIATNHGGACESITHGKTGWLVELDDVDGFAKALEETLSLTEKERKAFAEKSIKHVAENFNNEKMCNSVLDVYAELMDMVSVRVLPSRARLHKDIQKQING